MTISDIPVAVGWDMYDPRMTIKATVAMLGTDTAAAFDIDIGDCCFINGSGEIEVTDHSVSKTHGCALMAAEGGDELVLITHGRLKMVTEQTPGALVYPQDTAVDVGSPPDDTLYSTMPPCGFAIEAYLIFVHIDNASLAGI